MLVTSIFAFPCNVFYPIKEKFQHLIRIEIVVCKSFQFGKGSNFVVCKGLTFYQTTKFFDDTELKALANNKTNAVEKMKCVLEWLENIVGKGENAGFQHFHLFPQCFQKASFLGL